MPNNQKFSFEMSSTSAGTALKKYQHFWGQKCLILFIYIGTFSLSFNQRIGWFDEDGLNLAGIFFRSDIWFMLAAILALCSIPQLKIKGLPKKILFNSSVIFIVTAIFSSVMNGQLYDFYLDYFGLLELIKCILALINGIIIFQLAIKKVEILKALIKILTWTPLVNIFIVILFLITGINNIPGFNLLSGGDDNGAGFIGLGGRFQGVGSNPNIPAVQCCIAIGILIPKIINRGISTLKRISLAIYIAALGVIIIWTGVRAAVLSIFVMLIVLLWLNFRLTPRDLIKMSCILVFGVFFVGIILLLIPENMNIIKLRLDSGDGRFFLWDYYGSLLLKNPFGFGLGFKSIVDTNIGPNGMSLPPHNAILQAGMYAGYVGVGVSFYLIFKVLRVIAQIKKKLSSIGVSTSLIGLAAAWCSLVVNQMFAGLLTADLNFSILTALLLANFVRLTPNLATERHEVING